MKNITLEVTQPSTGPVCPGQEIILTCTVVQTSTPGVYLFLTWSYFQVGTIVIAITYDSGYLPSKSLTLGHFNTTVNVLSSTNSTVLVSNATLTSATLSNSNSTISCGSPPTQTATYTYTITIEGIIVQAVHTFTMNYNT